MNRLHFAAFALLSSMQFAGIAHAVTIDWVTVGDPGNANDPLTGNVYGSVAAEYRIMQFEWTNSQYVQFLNAIDPAGTNPNEVWNSGMADKDHGGVSFDTSATSGSKYAIRTNMGNKPLNYVSWFSAARVANWLHNGGLAYSSTDSSASAPQNTGAYQVGTNTGGNAPAKNGNARYWDPTEDEWYKAAFYNPSLNSGTGGYNIYGNGFSTQPATVTANAVGDGSAGPVGNTANYNQAAVWNGVNGNVTTVGTNGGASYYGAFDMSGNVFELNDLTGAASASRGIMGGDWINPSSIMLSSAPYQAVGTSGMSTNVGFRLAAVPEPSTYAMALAGLACGGWQMFRRRRAIAMGSRGGTTAV